MILVIGVFLGVFIAEVVRRKKGLAHFFSRVNASPDFVKLSTSDMGAAKTYDDYIKISILANNEFGIREIRDFSDVNTIYLVRSDYPKIVELIMSRNFDQIKIFQPIELKTSEYISVSTFRDQNNKNYVVTSYDSDELNQDPQVIDIFDV